MKILLNLLQTTHSNCALMLIVMAFIVTGCSVQPIEQSPPPPERGNSIIGLPDVAAARDTRPMIIGKKLENPFSVENMRKALDSLRNEPQAKLLSVGVDADNLNHMEIEVTDLYVRMQARTVQAHDIMCRDTTVARFPFPLDHEIKQHGDYIDPNVSQLPQGGVSSSYPVYYATVKPGFVPYDDVDYEVLCELFLPEHSNYYTEDTMATRSNKRMFDVNTVNSLLRQSFRLTGNGDQIKGVQTKAKPTTRGYYPSGTIRVEVYNNLRNALEVQAVSGVLVRMYRWFYHSDGRTNGLGTYVSEEYRNELWINDNIDYHIIFTGQYKLNNWSFHHCIGGVVPLDESWYDAGTHNSGGHSVTFYTNSADWSKCVLNNALYNGLRYNEIDKMATPPSHMKIACGYNEKYVASAPLLNKIIKIDNKWIYAFFPPAWIIIEKCLPDLIFTYTRKNYEWDKMSNFVFHELTHASQFGSMSSTKGVDWAKKYWNKNVIQQASNSIGTGDAYGHRGSDNWQMIALSEGWASYRDSTLSLRYHGYKHGGAGPQFPINYQLLFNALVRLKFAPADIEKSLAAYTLEEFIVNLEALYPNKKGLVRSYVTRYDNK